MSIFGFLDVRLYLNHFLKNLPRKGFGESKKMAEYLSVSTTFMSQVLSGKKWMTLEQASVLSKYLGHSKLEAEYLFYLVQLDRAGNQELKRFCLSKLEELKNQSSKLGNRIEDKKNFSELETSIFYSHSIYSAIHLFCATKENGITIDEIMNRFDLSRTRTSEIMRFLTDAGICSESNGLYLIGTTRTHLKSDSPHMIRHHTNWRLKAIQAADNLKDVELMYTGNMALSKKDFEILRMEIVDFITAFLKKVAPSPSEELACLNIDWIHIRK